jgi:hypothetical protein
MPRSRPRKRRPKEPLQLSPSKQRTTRFFTPRQIWSGILAFCTLVGVVALWPRVTIESPGTIDPSHPYPLTFKVTNTGFIPPWNVRPVIGLCTFVPAPPAINLPDRCPGPLQTFLGLNDWTVSELERDEPMDVRLDDMFPLAPSQTFGAADISIKIVFRPWFFPKDTSIERRFQTRVEKDGTLSWVPRPLYK